jgi:catechol 2,3-dioxygenase-like lactoylglutathione lyase family enzyme
VLDHMTFRVTDIARAKAFYSAALAPLGYSLSFEGNFGGNILGFAYPDPAEADGKKADVWFIDGPSPYGGPPTTSGCHLAWRAQTRAQVDAFHAAALAAGGKDNGAPGLRPEYHAHYYGAFVIDPEGNNIEAVCHLPPPDARAG